MLQMSTYKKWNMHCHVTYMFEGATCTVHVFQVSEYWVAGQFPKIGGEALSWPLIVDLCGRVQPSVSMISQGACHSHGSFVMEHALCVENMPLIAQDM
jgi:hypothetical protein